MKKLLFILLVIAGYSASATNYYISAGGDNTTGLSNVNAWQNIGKLNSSMSVINAGDSILFNRGETFVGGIIMTKSGTSGTLIKFDCYGSGALPIITGLSNLTGWVNDAGGIWHSNILAASAGLLVVLNNSNFQTLGRYPNAGTSQAGYLTNTISYKKDTATTSALSTTINWTGALAAVRLRNWKINRCRITSHSGGQIIFNDPIEGIYIDVDKVNSGYGLFFEDDIRTLDQPGEWFLNKTTKDLSMYFGANNPTSYSMQASTVDYLFNISGGQSFLSIKNLDFEGANLTAIYGIGSTNINISNCVINNCYNGIFLDNNANSATLTNNTVTNILNNAIWARGTSENIQTNFVKNVGQFPGMGASGDGAYQGISQDGDFGQLLNNRIDSVGYNPCVFSGNNTKVNYNNISNYAFIKDDAGGIYTGNGFSDVNIQTGREVAFNTITNGIGAPFTTSNPQTNGIYIDARSRGVYVHDNTVSNLLQGAGLFLHVAENITARNNKFYNVLYGLYLEKLSSTQTLTNIIFTSNLVYPTSGGNCVYYLNTLLGQPTPTLNNPDTLTSELRGIFTRIDSNSFRTNITSQYVWDARKYWNSGLRDTLTTPANFARWQYITNQEINSAPTSTATNTFYTNPTSTPAVINYNTFSKVVNGVTYDNSYTLPAFTGAILFDNVNALGVAIIHYFLKRKHK